MAFGVHCALMRLFAKYVPSARSILDVGCGTAEHLRFLVGYQMVGLDIDPTFIRLAKRKLPSAEQWFDLFRSADLEVEYLSEGLTSRGLYVARA